MLGSGGGMSGTRPTLTSGESTATSGAGVGTWTGTNDQVSIVTEWQEEQLQLNPRSLRDGVVEIVGTDGVWSACATAEVPLASPAVPLSDAQLIPASLRPNAASSRGS
jgi:hypothetical protein